MFSVMVVCIAPLFATKKNRFLYRLYLSYFFTRHEETKVTSWKSTLHTYIFDCFIYLCIWALSRL